MIMVTYKTSEQTTESGAEKDSLETTNFLSGLGVATI